MEDVKNAIPLGSVPDPSVPEGDAEPSGLTASAGPVEIVTIITAAGTAVYTAGVKAAADIYRSDRDVEIARIQAQAQVDVARIQSHGSQPSVIPPE